MSSIVNFITVTCPSYYKPSTYLADSKESPRYANEPEAQYAFKQWQAWQKVARNVGITAAIVFVGVPVVTGGVALGILCILQGTNVTDIASVATFMNVVKNTAATAGTVLGQFMTMGMGIPSSIDTGSKVANFSYLVAACAYNSTILQGLWPVDFIPMIGNLGAMFLGLNVFKEGGLATLGLQYGIAAPIAQAITSLDPKKAALETWKELNEKIDGISMSLFNELFYSYKVFTGGTSRQGPVTDIVIERNGRVPAH